MSRPLAATWRTAGNAPFPYIDRVAYPGPVFIGTGSGIRFIQELFLIPQLTGNLRLPICLNIFCLYFDKTINYCTALFELVYVPIYLNRL